MARTSTYDSIRHYWAIRNMIRWLSKPEAIKTLIRLKLGKESTNDDSLRRELNAWLEVVVVALETHRRAAPENDWAGTALSLLGEVDSLVDKITNKRGDTIQKTGNEFVKEGGDEYLIMRRVCIIAVNHMRENSKFSLGLSSSDIVWRRIMGAAHEAGIDIHSQDLRDHHILQLHAYIRNRYPNDNNLPRTIDGLLNYFHFYGAEEVDPQTIESSIPEQENTSPDLAFVQSLLNFSQIGEVPGGSGAIDLGSRLHGELHKCLGSLPKTHRDALDVKYELNLDGRDPPRTAKEYRKEESVTRYEYDKRCHKALAWMRDCIDTRLSSEAWTLPAEGNVK